MAGKTRSLPDTTRMYFLTGGQHGPAPFPPPKNHAQNLTNPNDYRWAMRALLVAMDRWVRDGAEPPASLYPRIAQDTLVPLGAVQFPKIPGVSLPVHMQKAYRVDYGPEFRTQRIVSVEPPKVGQRVSHSVAAGGPRRQRNLRPAHAGGAGAACHLHRMEPAVAVYRRS